jgi:AcrR family transcriptional regulator
MMKALDHRVRVAALRREEMQLHLLFSGLMLASTNSIYELEVEDIVRQAEVSRGSFYKYFPSLPAFYHDLANRLMQEILGVIDVMTPQSVDSVTRLSCKIRILMRLAVDIPVLGKFLSQIRWPNKSSVVDVFENIILDIHLGIKEGRLAKLPVSIGSNILIGSLVGGIHAMLSEPPATGYEDKVTHQVLLGLGMDPELAAEISKSPLQPRPPLPDVGILGKLGGL